MVSSKILLYLLLFLEGGPDTNKLNLTRGFVDDVRQTYGYTHTYDEVCRSKARRNSYTILYLRKYKALGSYEKAVRVFTGGSRDQYGAKANSAWKRAQGELKRIKKLQGRVP